jgi:hypothetical protein
MRALLAWVLAAGLCLFLGRFELHTDDAGVLLGFLMLSGALVALLDPRRPWRWGLLLGAAIALADLWAARVGPPWWNLPAIGAVATAAAMAGAYATAFVRRLAQ